MNTYEISYKHAISSAWVEASYYRLDALGDWLYFYVNGIEETVVFAAAASEVRSIRTNKLVQATKEEGTV